MKLAQYTFTPKKKNSGLRNLPNSGYLILDKGIKHIVKKKKRPFLLANGAEKLNAKTDKKKWIEGLDTNPPTLHKTNKKQKLKLDETP